MNRDQKAAAVAEIADQIKESEAVFAVDYRGITVTQIADVRSKLRETDTTFRVVKNSLTERAADAAEVAELKSLLSGPTALMFVRGDAASAAKVVSTFNKETELLAFKGGVLSGAAIEAAQIQAIAKLPSRDVLYGQLVGLIASPITGLARSLNGLLGGLAIALGQVQEKKASGEIPAGDPPAAPAAEAPAETADAPADEPAAEAAAEPAQDEPADEAPADNTPAEPVAEAEAAPADEAPADEADTTSDNDSDADASA